jgi:hypothetical protein
MPRDIPVGNGPLLVNFDLRHQLRDLYWPHVGQENHTAGHPFRFGVWVEGARCDSFSAMIFTLAVTTLGILPPICRTIGRFPLHRPALVHDQWRKKCERRVETGHRSMGSWYQGKR